MEKEKDNFLQNQHEIFMHRAIQLAKLGGSVVFPNPMVGAVIVHNNIILGEGYHQKYGEAHAEVNAVNSVKDKSLLNEATIYVSLEPCAHTGKTPPCADLLVKYKFKTVVIGCQDPFSKVNGAGIARLKENGIEVIVPILEKECIELNKRFFTFHQLKRPYIILKWAESKDGFIDKIRNDEKGINQITGKESKIRTHQLRSEEHAILVGRKTIEIDNPFLTTREVTGRNPIRIILDPTLKTSADANVYNDANPTIVINQLNEENKENIHFAKSEMRNIQEIVQKLYDLGIVSCIIEGGATTLNAFINEDLWDEAYRFVGELEFSNGIRVNPIKIAPQTQTKLENDSLFIYRNKSIIGKSNL